MASLIALQVPAASVPRVVDTTGAGDHFAAGFLCGLLSGKPLETCARMGCAAGGACVVSMGAWLGPESLDMLENELVRLG